LKRCRVRARDEKFSAWPDINRGKAIGPGNHVDGDSEAPRERIKRVAGLNSDDLAFATLSPAARLRGEAAAIRFWAIAWGTFPAVRRILAITAVRLRLIHARLAFGRPVIALLRRWRCIAPRATVIRRIDAGTRIGTVGDGRRVIWSVAVGQLCSRGLALGQRWKIDARDLKIATGLAWGGACELKPVLTLGLRSRLGCWL
jgi:hypothetical protein